LPSRQYKKGTLSQHFVTHVVPLRHQTIAVVLSILNFIFGVHQVGVLFEVAMHLMINHAVRLAQNIGPAQSIHLATLLTFAQECMNQPHEVLTCAPQGLPSSPDMIPSVYYA
jgi:hypothetical protein